jgi:hypothetical protein
MRDHNSNLNRQIEIDFVDFMRDLGERIENNNEPFDYGWCGKSNFSSSEHFNPINLECLSLKTIVKYSIPINVLPKFILQKYIFSVLVGTDVTFNDFNEGCCFEIFIKLDDFYCNEKLYTKLRFTNVKRGKITIKNKICEDYNHRLGNCICLTDCIGVILIVKIIFITNTLY